MFVPTPETAVAALVAVAVCVILTVAIARRFGWRAQRDPGVHPNPLPTGGAWLRDLDGARRRLIPPQSPVTPVQPPLATPLRLAAPTPLAVPVRVVPTR